MDGAIDFGITAHTPTVPARLPESDFFCGFTKKKVDE